MSKEKRRTVPIDRLHLQPGWCLVLVDKDDERVGRVVGFPQGPKGSFRLADAESVIDLDEDAIEVDVAFDAKAEATKSLSAGRYAIMPVGKIAAFVAAEPKSPKVLLLP